MRLHMVRWVFIAGTLMIAASGTSEAEAQDRQSTTEGKVGVKDLSEEETPPPVDVDRTRGDHSKLAAFFQAGGSAMVLGVGLDYRPVAQLALRAGLSIFAVPMAMAAGGFLGSSGVFGPRSHKFELGLDYVHLASNRETRFLSPLVGYRYQPEHGGTFVRLTVQALARANFDGDIFPTAGLSLGYTQ